MPNPQTAASLWQLMRGDDPEALHARLRWHPSEIDRCVEERADALPEPLDADELTEMRAFNERCGADETTLAAIDRLGSPTARVVIAGQQPGILAGPLYAVYKTIGALNLAEELGRRHKSLHFVPIYWVASEDHDFDEVRRAFWPGDGGVLEELFAERGDGWAPGKMIGTLPSADLAELLVRRIHASTRESEFRKDVLDRVEKAYAGSPDWEEAFCRLFLSLFSGSGLVLVSPLMSWVRRRGVPILREEARHPGRSSKRVIERGAGLEKSGAQPALHRHPGAVNFFWLDEAKCRHALRATEDGKIEALPSAEDAAGDALPLASDGEELAAMVDRSPESFSFNVVTRPLIQDAIFPTVAQVVGPGEADYLTQVEAVYADFGVFTPVRFPRPQVLLVQNNVARMLKKYDISPEDAIQSDATALARGILEKDLKEGIVGEAGELHRRQIDELKSLRQTAGEDTSVTSAFDKLAQAMDKGYGMIQERILYSRQQDEHHLATAMTRIESSLRPTGKPQERILNPIVPFMVLHGPDWIVRLRELVTHDPAMGLQTIYLSDLELKE